MTHTTLPRADSSKAGPDHRRMLQRLRSRHRRIIVASSSVEDARKEVHERQTFTRAYRVDRIR